MAVGAVVARILTQYSDKGSKAAAKDINKLGKNFDAFAKKSAKAFGLAAAASAAFAIKVGVDAVKAAMEDQKSQTILANSLRNTVGASNEAIASVEEYISKQQLLVNVADSALRPSLSALLVATKDLTQAQALQAIALDTSAATGKDLQTVSIAIAKATSGNVGALKKLGIPLSDNIVKTKDFAGAMDVLKEAYGGAAGELAKTDPLTTLKLAFGEIQETLGFALLPVVKEFANYIITDVLPVVQSWIDLNKDKLATVLVTVAENVIALGKAIFGFVDYVSRNLTIIKVFASLIAGIFIASKVYAFATAIGLLIPTLVAFTTAAGSAGIATALLSAGVSAGAAAAALGAFAITAGALGVSFAASSKNANKVIKSYKGVQDISSKLGASTSGLSKVIATNTVVTTTNAATVKKLTAEQLLSLKVQKQLKEEFGVKATAETDPIQLEAARLNLIKQENLAIQAVDASYLAFIEKQMQANTNAQRYADIFNALKDNGKISSEEIDALAKAWGISRDAVIAFIEKQTSAITNSQRYADIIKALKDDKISPDDIDALAKAWGIPTTAVAAYITEISGLSEETYSGLDAPGVLAASGWNSAKTAVDAYYASLNQATTIVPTPSRLTGEAAYIDNFTNPITSQFDPRITGNALRPNMDGSLSAYNPDMAAAGMTSGGVAPTTNNFFITTVDPTSAGDAVVDAINSSTNIRGGYTGIGVSRAVTIL